MGVKEPCMTLKKDLLTHDAPTQVADKLAGLGFQSVSESDVVTSGWAAAEYLCAVGFF
jgi:ribonucleotide monophosphatase NagD (HAD superfamily)